MVYLYIFIVLAVLGLIYMHFEAGFVKVERVYLTKDSKGLKIIHLSDIHIDRLKVSVEKVRQVIGQEKPDLVVLTGDFIERPVHSSLFLNFLDKIKGEEKIILCLGNHDFRAFKNDTKGLRSFIRAIEQKGVTVLHNRSMLYEKNSKKYNLIGIGDLRTDNHDIAGALKTCSSNAFANIVLTHNPDMALNLPRNKVDYMLAGHFHGGQIWMPFNLEFKALREDKLAGMGMRRGLHKYNGINLYINRGLGNVCLTLRFMSRPEITVLHLP